MTDEITISFLTGLLSRFWWGHGLAKRQVIVFLDKTTCFCRLNNLLPISKQPGWQEKTRHGAKSVAGDL